MKVQLEKSLNSEMKLKMQLEEKTRGRPPGRCTAPCADRSAVVPVPEDDDEETEQTTTFYTELSVRVSLGRLRSEVVGG